jgi:hypothetical protein
MTDQHPITPPPELVQQWSADIYEQTASDDLRDSYIATQAARWGADQELEACCELLSVVNRWKILADRLCAARRPKSLSRKQRALHALAQIEDKVLSVELADEIRRALEALPDS